MYICTIPRRLVHNHPNPPIVLRHPRARPIRLRDAVRLLAISECTRCHRVEYDGASTAIPLQWRPVERRTHLVETAATPRHKSQSRVKDFPTATLARNANGNASNISVSPKINGDIRASRKLVNSLFTLLTSRGPRARDFRSNSLTTLPQLLLSAHFDFLVFHHA